MSELTTWHTRSTKFCILVIRDSTCVTK
uniref:Uncharacterized protein n=1 Tax=Arundo donax TaxID=35708 RepID=A0A0A9EIR6_ARUDO